MTGNLLRRLNTRVFFARMFLFLPQAVRATQTGNVRRMVLAGISLWSCVAIAISIRCHFLLRCG